MRQYASPRILRRVIRMVSWDGMLPALIWSSPLVLRLLLPDQPIAIEAAAIILPMAAFFLRFRVGKRHIATNACGTVMRGFQLVMLCIGIFLLVLIDAVMILAHIVPEGVAINTTDKLVFAGLYLSYLSAMALAMYPGMDPRPAARLSHLPGSYGESKAVAASHRRRYAGD